MFCPNCGEKIPDSSKFCPQCGGKIDLDEEPNKQAGNSAGTDQKSTPGYSQTGNNGNADGNPLKRLSNRTIGIIIAAAVVVVAVIVILIVVLSGGTTINLNKYVDITVTGSNGYGKAMAEINKDAIIEDYSGKLKWKDESNLETSALKLFYSDPVDALVDSLYGSLDQSSGLSNGDMIQFIWNMDAEDIESQIKVKLDYSDFDYKVSDLGDIDTYDAFADVSVEFGGISPNATASLSVVGGRLAESAYTLDKSENLAVGDTVTVTISESAVESLIETEEIGPKEMSHIYTVDGIPCYAQTLDDIPDDAMEKMETQAVEAFHDYSSRWAEVSHLNSCDFIGCYFLSSKPGSKTNYGNIIYFVFKVNLTIEQVDSEDIDWTYYTYYEYHDAIILLDGTFSIDYSDYSSCPNNLLNSGYHVYGYSDIETVFNKLITENIETYNYESTVSE